MAYITNRLDRGERLFLLYYCIIAVICIMWIYQMQNYPLDNPVSFLGGLSLAGLSSVILIAMCFDDGLENTG